MTKAKVVETYIDLSGASIWAIMKFAQEVDPAMRLDTANVFDGCVELLFSDDTSMSLVYLEE